MFESASDRVTVDARRAATGRRGTTTCAPGSTWWPRTPSRSRPSRSPSSSPSRAAAAAAAAAAARPTRP